MNETVIKIENLSKEYRLGQVGTGTISHDLNRWWCKIRGKEDPYLKIGETNDRENKGESDYIFALKDINLEVKKGEVLGIIGKNGAGKSTLLKILSKVTGPTTGSIKTKGRIASLLEVGTGFHPELTGRENIYMNGTVMGMTRKEINTKLDAIVEFAGIERYIDTPTKRYSSGMTVRLGFAIAAHLEPEILVVDEVLAVGDAEFQKKAIGKMNEISMTGGRTVLFVSHNMTAVNQLCDSAVLLENGEIKLKGAPNDIISRYLSMGSSINKVKKTFDINTAPGDDIIRLIYADIICSEKSTSIIPIDQDFYVSFDFINYKETLKNVAYSIHVYDQSEVLVFATNSVPAANLIRTPTLNAPISKGTYNVKIKIPGNFMNDQSYKVHIAIISNTTNIHVLAKDILAFSIFDTGYLRESNLGTWGGCVRLKFETVLTPKDKGR